MLTLRTLLRATRQMASYGELGVAVPRDHCPPDYYQTRVASDSWYCDQCHVEVQERRCPHCGKTRRENRGAS